MVRLAGIEPTTPWFVAKYSIQLSYSREALECISSTQPSSQPRGGLETLRDAPRIALLLRQRSQ